MFPWSALRPTLLLNHLHGESVTVWRVWLLDNPEQARFLVGTKPTQAYWTCAIYSMFSRSTNVSKWDISIHKELWNHDQLALRHRFNSNQTGKKKKGVRKTVYPCICTWKLINSDITIDTSSVPKEYTSTWQVNHTMSLEVATGQPLHNWCKIMLSLNIDHNLWSSGTFVSYESGRCQHPGVVNRETLHQAREKGIALPIVRRYGQSRVLCWHHCGQLDSTGRSSMSTSASPGGEASSAHSHRKSFTQHPLTNVTGTTIVKATIHDHACSVLSDWPLKTTWILGSM